MGSKTKSVGGFVFGLLVFPRGTRSAPDHAKKNRESRKPNDKMGSPDNNGKEGEAANAANPDDAPLCETCERADQNSGEQREGEASKKPERGRNKLRSTGSSWISVFVEGR